MSADCNTILNQDRLQHGGTTQPGRQAAALQPDYVQVDERRFADWIVFARDYARFLQYTNVQNTPDGDWTPFWSGNPSTVLANLAAAPVDLFREHTRLIFIELEKIDNTTDDLLLRQYFNLLFDAIASLSYQLDAHYLALPEDIALKTTLRNRIQNQLAPALAKWMRWHQAAAAVNPPLFPVLDAGTTTLLPLLQGWRILGGNLLATADLYTPAPGNPVLSDIWAPGASNTWVAHVASLTPDDTIFGNVAAMATVAEPVRFALRHYFFTGVFEQFLQNFASIVAEAEAGLNSLLHNWNQHEPHVALYLAFLRILQEEQIAMNTLTDRHLRYYYERVLRLKPRAPQAAQAHLLVELSKPVNTHLLPAGTALNAGKDATGKAITFTTVEDLVVNKAQVTELKSIFKAPAQINELQLGDPERPLFVSADRNRYFAAPVANSADGLGEALTTTDGRWYPFGNRIVNEGANRWEIKMPRADLGFAIASNYLFMSQGSRTIRLQMQGTGAAALLGKRFQVFLTTEKGWLESTQSVVWNAGSSTYDLAITLDGDDPAIVPYQEKVHQQGFQTPHPVLRALLVHDTPYAYEELKNLTLTTIRLDVNVTGKRDMALSGSTGPLDASKPFHPFGVAPETGAVFHLGDRELFQKNAAATLRVQWKEYDGYRFYDPHTHNVHPNTTAAILQTGQWADLSNGDLIVHSSGGATTFSFSVGNGQRTAPAYGANEAYQVKHSAGYLRFNLVGDWGHAEYPMALTKYISKNGLEPARLYDPQILDITLDYAANASLSPAANTVDAPVQLLHIGPFGHKVAKAQGGAVPLLPLVLPQYTIDTPDGPLVQAGKAAGALFLGIDALTPPQTLSLLFQIANGSADPLLAKPEQHVQWSYLRDNEWVDFEADELSDGTAGLLQSGIVRLSFPKEATANNTWLPAGKYWVRIGVQSAVDAVGQLVGIHTQAVTATFTDNGNDPQLMATPIKAGTIAKLKVPRAEVKKIAQPYDTFNGKAAEAAQAYSTRVSERLRHKQRAITQWDYEHLVLEAFPQVHQARCLNHLRYEPGSTQAIYRELAPGHVTLLTVANQQQQSAVDPLRPYVSLADLENIHAFIKNISSCFVNLHVRNPQFEPVLLFCRVQFFDGYDETFYRQALSDEVVRFLSPWAFPGGGDVDFSHQFSLAQIINFIEERHYVDFVQDARLYHLTDPTQRGVEVVKPTRQVSVLVSAKKHWILPLDVDLETAWTEVCACGEPSTAFVNLTPTR